jgi:Zn-dependent protease
MYSLGTLVFAALVFTTSFLAHEISHKFVAQHYGLWAEFRLTVFGALLTLISIVSPFKIVSPGAVMISGYSSKETVGKTAISGPLVNIGLGFISLAATSIKLDPVFTIALFSAALNSFIAVFNLIPFAMFDGLKVFRWNRLVWALVFTMSLALLIIIYVLYPQIFI